jgi:hypothetical protein
MSQLDQLAHLLDRARRDDKQKDQELQAQKDEIKILTADRDYWRNEACRLAIVEEQQPVRNNTKHEYLDEAREQLRASRDSGMLTEPLHQQFYAILNFVVLYLEAKE